MKKLKYTLLILVLAIGGWSGYTFRKLNWESDFGRPWVVDVEASVSHIESVPESFKSRYATVEGYRNYVRNLVHGLTLTLHEDGTASLRRGGGVSIALEWRKDDDFDYWLNTKEVWWLPVASIGHGYERVSAHTARLKYQVEWSEDVATREFLLLRR